MGKREKYKENNAKLTKAWQKTKKGLTAKIYTTQRKSSKSRNMDMPNYTLDELRAWVFEQDIFHSLYDIWVSNGYMKEDIPSCDRLNDYKPYTLDNIELKRFKDNESKPKMSMGKKVVMYDTDWNELKTFNNSAEAARYFGGNPQSGSNILAVCKGVRNKAFKHYWKFEEDKC